MSLEAMMREVMEESPYLPADELTITTQELKEEDRDEVLAFLSERPLHTVCLLANEGNERAHRFHRSCGFRLRSVYDMIFLGGR